MDAEKIRQARLRYPFEPFVLRIRDGRDLPVSVPEHLAVSHRAVVVFDSQEQIPERLAPSEIVALHDQNGVSQKNTK